MQAAGDHNMDCYFCAEDGESNSAVGACAQCGAAACHTHGGPAAVPTFVKSSGGIGGPYIRAKRDRRRFLCSDCAAEATEDGAAVYLESLDG